MGCYNTNFWSISTSEYTFEIFINKKWKYSWKCDRCFVVGDLDWEWSMTETSFRWSGQGRPEVWFITCLYEEMRIVWTRFREESQRWLMTELKIRPMRTIPKNQGCQAAIEIYLMKQFMFFLKFIGTFTYLHSLHSPPTNSRQSKWFGWELMCSRKMEIVFCSWGKWERIWEAN